MFSFMIQHFRQHAAVLTRTVLAAFTAAVCFAGCGEAQDTNSMNDDQTFVVGVDCGYVPFCGPDRGDGEFEGYDIDLARETARRNGWKLRVLAIDWRLKESMINSGEIDCVWCGFMRNGRENDYEWTRPYLGSSYCIVVRRYSGISTAADLEGKCLATQSSVPGLAALLPGGSAYETIGSKCGRIKPIDDILMLLTELRDDPSCDAIMLDRHLAESWIQENQLDYVITDIPVVNVKYAVGCKLGSVDLRKKIEAALDDMAKDGTLAKITIKWFKRDISIYRYPEVQ